MRKPYHLLTLAHRNQGQPDRALEVCRAGLVQFPDDAELLGEEGLLLRDQGDLAGAERSWLRLLDSRRGQYFASEEVGLRGFKTRHLLAEVYRAQRRWKEAEIQWLTVRAERGDFEPAWQALAELYLGRERWADLEYLLQDLEARGVPATRLGWLRARAQVQRKEYAFARQTLRSLIAHEPRGLGPRRLLCKVLLEEERDWAAAEQGLREVLEIDPDHEEARHNSKVLLRRLGREAALIVPTTK